MKSQLVKESDRRDSSVVRRPIEIVSNLRHNLGLCLPATLPDSRVLERESQRVPPEEYSIYCLRERPSTNTHIRTFVHSPTTLSVDYTLDWARSGCQWPK